MNWQGLAGKLLYRTKGNQGNDRQYNVLLDYWYNLNQPTVLCTTVDYNHCSYYQVVLYES